MQTAMTENENTGRPLLSSSLKIPRNFGPRLMVFLVVSPLTNTSSLHLLSKRTLSWTGLLQKLRQFALLQLPLSVTHARLSVLMEITSLELRNLIMAAAPKTCELDHIYVPRPGAHRLPTSTRALQSVDSGSPSTNFETGNTSSQIEARRT